MGKVLYVGNLPYSVDESSLESSFASCGTVTSCRVVTDRDTGRSKGFGFVEMSTDEEANSAIDKMNGYELDGRSLRVSEAREKTGGGGGGGGRGPRGGGGGRGFGGGGRDRDGGGYGGGRGGRY